MTSMILASSPLSAQSFVKLRTNSNYSHSPCFVSRVKNSYVHLPYKNISHIESSKSLFVKGDSNFSFSSPKFPRYSPSLNVIKASYAANTNVYGFYAQDVDTGENFKLSDRYGEKNKILLFVNLPQEISKKSDDNLEIKFLNDLCDLYAKKGFGFEILGFFPRKESHRFRSLISKQENTGLAEGEKKIRDLANFSIYRKVYADNDYDNDNLWNFLRWRAKEVNSSDPQNAKEIEGKFEKFLVDKPGTYVKRFPWFEGQTKEPQMVKPGEYPGDHVEGRVIDPTNPLKGAIDGYFKTYE